MTTVSLSVVRRLGAAGTAGLVVAAASISMSQGAAPASASTLAPPMLDITRQCDASSRRNVRAMSECVVAESEARAEILQKWNKISDASAERCIKLGRKTKRNFYAALAQCVAAEPVDMRAAASPPIVSADKPDAGGSGGSVTDWFLRKTGVRK